MEDTTDTDFAAELRQRARSRQLIVSVDRLDYTKGIVERLAAYDLAFQEHDLDPDDVHIVQIAQPSRTHIAAYQALRVELERIVHQLDADSTERHRSRFTSCRSNDATCSPCWHRPTSRW